MDDYGFNNQYRRFSNRSSNFYICRYVFKKKKTAEAKLKGAENEAQRIIEMANKEAENKKKEEIFKAKKKK